MLQTHFVYAAWISVQCGTVFDKCQTRMIDTNTTYHRNCVLHFFQNAQSIAHCALMKLSAMNVHRDTF